MKHLFFVVLILILLLPHPGLAAGIFNKNFIISDEEFFNPDGMTLAEVQQFLESRNSALAHYVATDVDGALRSAAEIIWCTAVAFHVNPKLFLVLLQKEQSLVDTQHLTQYQLDWATGYARCDTCSQDHPGIQDTKGLASQIYLAGQWINEKYLPAIAAKGKTAAGFGPGIVKRIDRSVNVKPANRATSILYTYTPHIAGNKHFWNIWNKWFSPVYPDGSLLQDKKTGGVWLIENGSRRPFASKVALTSRYDSKKIIQVDSDDLARYPEGPPITGSAGYPLGALFQDAKTGGVFFVLDGARHPIIDKQILTLYWKGRPIKKTTEAELNKFTAGEPVGFKNGEMVGYKKTGQIYLISNSLRRPVAKEVLQALGFDPEKIIWTSEKLLALHAVGESLSFTTTSPEALAATAGSGSQDVVAANNVSGPEINGNSLVSDDAPNFSTDVNENNIP